MQTRFTLTTFTPGEAEKITGLSTAMQRDWRRPERSYLPSFDGHARHDAFGLAHMWTLKLLSDRKIGPQEGAKIAPICATGIVWNALQWSDAFEGDHLAVNEWKFKRTPPAIIAQHKQNWHEQILGLQARVTDDDESASQLERLHERDEKSLVWGDTARWMSFKILEEHRGARLTPARFFIWWANGTEVWHESLDRALNDMTSDDPRCSGPIVVLDLQALGATMLDRAGRPFVHVEFENEANAE